MISKNRGFSHVSLAVVLSLTLIATLVLTACQPQVVEKEVVVTQIVEVAGEEVEVTKVVEVERELEELPYGLTPGKPYDGTELNFLVCCLGAAQFYALSEKGNSEFYEMTGIKVVWGDVP